MPKPGEPGYTDPGTGESFLDGITNEELRGNEHLSGVDSLDTLAQNFVDLRSNQPTIPETPDAYTLDIDMEDPNINPEALTAFRDVAHGAKLSDESFQAVVNFDIARAKEAANAEKVAYDATVAELGEAAPGIIETGKKVMVAAGLEDMADHIDSSSGLLKLMAWVSSKMSEDTLELGGKPPAGGPDPRPKGVDGKTMLDFSKSMPE